MKAYQNEKYYSDHEACPKCQTDQIIACTNPSYEDDRNTNHAWCQRCDWKGIVDELKPSLKKENLDLRRLLFLLHSCEGKSNDDGEMQCGECGVDFKRMSPDEIAGRIWIYI